MAALADARGVSKSYALAGRAVTVLRDVDLTIARGDFVAIEGRSGSGKSTLLHILGALDGAFRGSYRYDGTEVGALGDEARSRLRATGIGFVFQSFHLLPHLTVLENVVLPFRYAGAERFAPERAAEAVAQVGLAHRMHHRPAQLSGGEAQRAAIARATVMRPGLLLADEPTGNLDAQTGAQVIDALEALNAAGTALVLVTHDPGVARRARRRLRLMDGRLDG
ncbi:MAG TPA: ABC transporter ATP-binding protein [Usitatibacter sp.]|nr:ABC transporter ATP-binding protein [Usitatibacter sp.]